MGLLNILLGGSSSNTDNQFKIGDRVRVKYRGQEGYIIDKNGSLYTVSLADGAYVDDYSAEDLEICW